MTVYGKRLLHRTYASAFCLAASLASQNAYAEEEASQGDIVVTARKRPESILQTPVSINALTSEAIEQRGIVSVNDIAAQTPGLNVQDNGSGRNDRSFQQVILRGFTPSNPIVQTASVFIDGVPVASAIALSSVTNPERVEILRGPQSAYFGRQTFAGAMNMVTKAPGKDWGGSVSGMVGTRNNHDVMAELTGPIVPDVLSVRATVRQYAKDGSYQNAGVPGQTLGDQASKTGSLALEFTPSSRLKVKLFGMLTVNDDGPSAQGLIGAYEVRDDNGKVIVAAQGNCTFPTGATFFCGTAPALVNSPSANTLNDAFIQNFLKNPTGRLIAPEDGVQGYGLHSRFFHAHAVVDWSVTDTLTLSSMTGINRDRNSILFDLDNYYSVSQTNVFGGPGSRSYFDFPFLVEQKQRDWSQELRASWNAGHLRATVGGSFLDSYYQNGLGGGNGALGTAPGGVSTKLGISRAKTTGAFFGLTYKFNPMFSVSFDGRYQIDHMYAYDANGAPIVDHAYKNFLPRAIAEFHPDSDTMIYASASRGVNPGSFNSGLLNPTAAEQQLINQYGLKIAVDPEFLDNYEIGIKGQLFNRAVSYSLAAYHAIWRNQINSVQFTSVPTDGSAPLVVGASYNSGRVRVNGIEAEISASVTPRLKIDAAGSINDTYIKSLSAGAVTQITGVSDFTGKQNPLTSKYSAVVGAMYTVPLGKAGTKGYIRADVSYKSGVYSNAANIVKTPDQSFTNLRIGINTHAMNVEAFVTNLFNSHAYTSIADGALFTPTFGFSAVNSALVAGLPDLRTAGLRVKYNF